MTDIKGININGVVYGLEDTYARTRGGLSDDAKAALLDCFAHVAWVDDDGQDYYDALEAALYPPAEVVSISAVYTQSGAVYNTDSLDDLRSDLVVTATYSDSTTQTVTTYTLSGTLTVGTSTVTVAYGGKTTSFTVTVTEAPAPYTLLNSFDFTSSMTDSVNSVVATTNATQDSSGITFSALQKYIEIPNVFNRDRTYEIDIGSFTKTYPNDYGRIFMVDSDSDTSSGGSGYITSGTKKGGDLFYMNGSWESAKIVDASTDADGSYYANSTLGFYVDADGICKIYKDGTLLGTSSSAFNSSYNTKNVYIGSSNADRLSDLVVTGLRVYEGNRYA